MNTTSGLMGAASIASLLLMCTFASVGEPQDPTGGVTPPPSKHMIEAARREGQVVWYTALEAPLAASLAKDFEKRFGIRVNLVRGSSGEIIARVRAELAQPRIDVVQHYSEPEFIQLKEKGMLRDLTAIDTEAFRLRRGFVDPQKAFFAVDLEPIVLVYNTRLTKDRPTEWKDILSAKWMNNLAVISPRAESGLVQAGFWADNLGAGYLEALAKRSPYVAKDASEVGESVAAGKRLAGIATLDVALSLANKNVGYTIPTPGIPVMAGNVGVAKNAPHPGGGALFAWYLGTREAQSILVKGLRLPSRVDLDLGELSAFQSANLYKPDWQKLSRERENLLKRWDDVIRW